MSIAPRECDACAHLQTGSAAGEPRDVCRHGRKFFTADNCRTLGFYETVQQLRERAVIAQNEQMRLAVLEINAEAAARRAHRLGVR